MTISWSTPVDLSDGDTINAADNWNIHLGASGNMAYLHERAALNKIINIATSRALTVDEVKGGWITNTGAVATVEDELPAAVVGYNVNLCATVAKQLKIKPASGVFMFGLVAGHGSRMADTGLMIEVMHLR